MTDTRTTADILSSCGALRMTDAEAMNLAASITRAGYTLTPLPPPPVQDAPTPPEPDDPTPVPGLTLQALQSLTQDVEHCGQPMRFVVGRCTWDGQPGHGHERITTTRACTTCGAVLTASTVTPR